jgi:hypothetical protein
MSRAIAAIFGSAEQERDRSQVQSFGRPFGAAGAAIAMFWRQMARNVVSPYRPEKHYMRGPGPAWQAKYGTLRAGHAAD